MPDDIKSSVFYLREGTRQAGMCTFPFAAARERKKLAKRVFYRCYACVKRSSGPFLSDGISRENCRWYNTGVLYGCFIGRYIKMFGKRFFEKSTDLTKCTKNLYNFRGEERVF